MPVSHASSAAASQRVAAIQLCSGADLARNLATIDALLGDAAQRGVTLVLLPENAFFMGALETDKLALAETPGAGPMQDFLASAAVRHDLWIVAGSLPLASPQAGKVFGACVVYDNHGTERGIYRKIHLFDVDLPDAGERYRESATMQPGDAPLTVDTPVGRLGLSICYDLRFPELFRQLVDDGATVFTVPAAFTAATGKAHWRTLLRARAIENVAFVIAAAQHGVHPSMRQTWGHSMIVDPWGKVLAELAHGEGVVDAVIDASQPAKLRQHFPVLGHRKL